MAAHAELARPSGCSALTRYILEGSLACQGKSCLFKAIEQEHDTKMDVSLESQSDESFLLYIG